MPLVSVIIPTYRDWERLALCLDALRSQTYPASQIEILVVNNDSDAVPPAFINLPSNAWILQEARPGSYAARNRGVEDAKGDLIGFTDSDCVPELDWVANAVSEAISQEGESFRITGPVRLFRNPGESWLAWKFESITAFNQRHNVRSGVAVTANLFVSRAVFERVGMFDAALFSGGDIAWNRLASQQGVALVYSDNVVVNHPARATVKEIVLKARRVLGGGYINARRDGQLIKFTLRHLVPPLKFIKVLLQDGKKFPDVMVAILFFWLLKISMIFEILRLLFGGKPLR